MTAESSSRSNQRRRTRKDLLQAAWRLMQQGGTPTLEEVAAEALVSRATAYRYFPSIDALLLEAALDVDVPDPEALFPEGTTQDPIERLERAEAALHGMIARNEAPLRIMLANSLRQAMNGEASTALPARQNRRGPLIEAALEPVRGAIPPATMRRLAQALAILVGTESMVVCKDVLNLDDEEAADTRRWAIRALVRSALDPSK